MINQLDIYTNEFVESRYNFYLNAFWKRKKEGLQTCFTMQRDNVKYYGEILIERGLLTDKQFWDNILKTPTLQQFSKN